MSDVDPTAILYDVAWGAPPELVEKARALAHEAWVGTGGDSEKWLAQFRALAKRHAPELLGFSGDEAEILQDSATDGV